MITPLRPNISSNMSITTGVFNSRLDTFPSEVEKKEDELLTVVTPWKVR